MVMAILQMACLVCDFGVRIMRRKTGGIKGVGFGACFLF